MHLPCVYAKLDGLSYLADLKLSLEDYRDPASSIAAWSGLMSLKGWTVYSLRPMASRDWHVTPAPALGILLSGTVVTEVGGHGGMQRIAKPGDINLSLDTIGQGHRTRVLGADPVFGMGLAFAGEDFRYLLAKLTGLPSDAVIPTPSN